MGRGPQGAATLSVRPSQPGRVPAPCPTVQTLHGTQFIPDGRWSRARLSQGLSLASEPQAGLSWTDPPPPPLWPWVLSLTAPQKRSDGAWGWGGLRGPLARAHPPAGQLPAPGRPRRGARAGPEASEAGGRRPPLPAAPEPHLRLALRAGLCNSWGKDVRAASPSRNFHGLDISFFLCSLYHGHKTMKDFVRRRCWTR